MKLFKRLLLSLFPENIVDQPINPASMFVSFIAAKQFFSVVNRKIVENYKLNMFDVALDAFDVKIGFGEYPTLKPKNLDFYYSYGVVANFNGYRFYGPSNIGSLIAMVLAIYTKEIFLQKDTNYFSSFLLSIYLIGFLFLSKIKVFPYDNDKKNYTWFINLFFEFYKFVLDENGSKITKEEFEQIKNEILKQDIQVFFMLYYYYKRLNNVFAYDKGYELDFYNWIFHDDSQNSSYKNIIKDFLENNEKYIFSEKFSVTEKKIVNLIFPADVLVRYLFEGEDIFLMSDILIKSIFDKEKLDIYMNSFLKDDHELENFINYISDYHLFKESYFLGLKKFIIHKFKKEEKYDADNEIDNFVSSIGSMDDIANIKIPERLKKESMIMEKLINFYITFLGGFWIGRGDNFYLRLFKKDLLIDVLRDFDVTKLTMDSLSFYGKLFDNYSKNIFYYKYAFDSVKAGKDKFNLPFKPTSKEIYSSFFLLKSFNENFLNNIFQDTYSKDIKIYVQNKEILGLFKNRFYEKISKIVNASPTKCINLVYGVLDDLLPKGYGILTKIKKTFGEKEILNIKENSYMLDFCIWHNALELMHQNNFNLDESYDYHSILGVFSHLRETFSGFLFYLKFVQNKSKLDNKDYKINMLKKIYLTEIIGVSELYYEKFILIIDKLIEDCADLLEKWSKIDDNELYFMLGLENWIEFIDSQSIENASGNISGEDIIWFNGYLKNITFYNKRYLIPRE